MKTIVLLFLFIPLLTFSQLKPEASVLKEKVPETYQAIKEFAINEWEDDHSMILYEINKQSKAYVECLAFLRDDENARKYGKILFEAIYEWSDLDSSASFETIKSNNTVNWAMVLYEAKKQIKAMESY